MARCHRNGLRVAFVAAALAVLGVAAPLQAAQFSSSVQSARVLGMGGAFTAVADDASALIYNPAGLTQLDGFSMDLLPLEAEVSESAVDLAKDLRNFQGTEAAAVDLLRRNIGTHIRTRVNLMPHVVTPHFGIGILGQAILDGDVRNQQNPTVNVSASIDVGLTAAVAKGFKSDKLAIGIGGKYVRREGLIDSFTALDIATNQFNPLADVGSAETDFAFDVGALYHLKSLPLSPTLGVAALNVGDLDFGPFGSVPFQLNLGIAVRPKLGPLQFTVAADFVDVTHNLANDSDPRKRTNLGAEVALWKFLAVRAGLHQSYFSAGATLSFWVVKLDLATYGEELGAYGGQREDRRIIARLTLF